MRGVGRFSGSEYFKCLKYGHIKHRKNEDFKCLKYAYNKFLEYADFKCLMYEDFENGFGRESG